MRDFQRLTVGRPLWPIDWFYFWAMTRRIWWTADSTGSRATIAAASIGFALALLLDPTTLYRPAYALMLTVPTWVWIAGFLAHGVLAIWRIYERRSRIGWAIFTNALGLTVWGGYVIANAVTLKTFPAGSALEWVVLFRMAVILARSGLNEEATTP